MKTSATAVSAVRVLTDQGSFTDTPVRVSWEGGRFSIGASVLQPSAEYSQDGDLWMIPGIVDAHLHAAWHAFSEEERERATPEEREAKTRDALRATLDAGITSARDAGGLTARLVDEIPLGERPRVQTSVAMIDREAADWAGGIERAAAAALEAGARWIKLVATASVASSPDSDLASAFSAQEFSRVSSLARQASAGVMVHAWGGPAIDHAIESGATSIEHGIFLTPDQAARAADRGLVFVPTLRIYRLVQGMISRGDLPTPLGPRVEQAVKAHPMAVRIARDAGLGIALGSDYGTAAQHGTNRLEFDALVDAGLEPEAALIAATTTGAELLARVVPRADAAGLPSGRIADGEIADAVILTRDPREPGAFSDTRNLLAVILDGRVISPNPTIAKEHQ